MATAALAVRPMSSTTGVPKGAPVVLLERAEQSFRARQVGSLSNERHR
jgi:hypothetical protein